MAPGEKSRNLSVLVIADFRYFHNDIVLKFKSPIQQDHSSNKTKTTFTAQNTTTEYTYMLKCQVATCLPLNLIVKKGYTRKDCSPTLNDALRFLHRNDGLRRNARVLLLRTNSLLYDVRYGDCVAGGLHPR